MRTPFFLIQKFPQSILEQDNAILWAEDIDNEEKLSVAAKYLGIDLIDFDAIPFHSSKVEYLRYKYVLLEFELYPKRFQKHQTLNVDLYRKLAQKSYEIFLHSQLLNKPHPFSEFSRGLSDMYQRSEYKSRPAPSELQSLEQSVLAVADKRGGIEPGFEAVLHQDIVLFLDKKFQGKIEAIRAYVNEHEADFTRIYKDIKHELPKYMFKMDYQSEGSSSKVKLSKKDVSRTSTVKKFKAKNQFVGDVAALIMVALKSDTSDKKNWEAVSEVVGNAIASMCMPAQEQTLFKTVHDNGKLKLMPKSRLLTEVEELGSSLAGGLDDKDNYRARWLLLPQAELASVTDDRITNDGQSFMPLLFPGDYDKVGSKGQNLLIRKLGQDDKTGKESYELVGIDFGHVFREANPLLDEILLDARFRQPRRKPFKNFSVLTDVPLSEIMKGVLILAQMGGKKIDEQLIEEYRDPSFSELMARISPNEAEKVLDDYISSFEHLAETEVSNKGEYLALASALKKTREILAGDLARIQVKFGALLEHSPEAINLASNLQKLSAALEGKTSLRSPDGRHGLRHLRITDLAFAKLWNIHLGSDDFYHFSIALDNSKTVESLLTHLKTWAGPEKSLSIQSSSKQVSIRFPKHRLQAVFALLSEERIKQSFHAEDDQAIKLAYQELGLQDLTRAPWFAERKLQLQLTLHPKQPQTYRLVINAEESADPLLLDTLKESFADTFSGDAEQPLLFDFKPDQIPSIYKGLLQWQAEYELALKLQHLQLLACQLSARLERILFLRFSLTRINAHEMAFSVGGEDKKELRAFLINQGLSAQIMTKADGFEFFCATEDFERLAQSLEKAAEQIINEKEQRLEEEKLRRLELEKQVLAEILAVEERYRREKKEEEASKKSSEDKPIYSQAPSTHKVAFFSPEMAHEEREFELSDAHCSENESEVLIITLQQYIGHLSQFNEADYASGAELSWFSLGWQQMKNTVNFYGNSNSSAALIPKLKDTIERYPHHHGTDEGFKLLSNLQEALKARGAYIAPFRAGSERYVLEAEHLTHTLRLITEMGDKKSQPLMRNMS